MKEEKFPAKKGLVLQNFQEKGVSDCAFKGCLNTYFKGTYAYSKINTVVC